MHSTHAACVNAIADARAPLHGFAASLVIGTSPASHVNDRTNASHSCHASHHNHCVSWFAASLGVVVVVVMAVVAMVAVVAVVVVYRPNHGGMILGHFRCWRDSHGLCERMVVTQHGADLNLT